MPAATNYGQGCGRYEEKKKGRKKRNEMEKEEEEKSYPSRKDRSSAQKTEHHSQLLTRIVRPGVSFYILGLQMAVEQ